jgi:hypothetical protein
VATNPLSPNDGPNASPEPNRMARLQPATDWFCKTCGRRDHLLPQIRFARKPGQTWGGRPYVDHYLCSDCKLNRRGNYRYNRYTGQFDVLLGGKQIGRAATFLDAERQAEDALRAVDDGETTLERLAAAWAEREAWIADGNTFDEWQVAR